MIIKYEIKSVKTLDDTIFLNLASFGHYTGTLKGTALYRGQTTPKVSAAQSFHCIPKSSGVIINPQRACARGALDTFEYNLGIIVLNLVAVGVIEREEAECNFDSIAGFIIYYLCFVTTGNYSFFNV